MNVGDRVRLNTRGLEIYKNTSEPDRLTIFNFGSFGFIKELTKDQNNCSIQWYDKYGKLVVLDNNDLKCSYQYLEIDNTLSSIEMIIEGLEKMERKYET